MKKDFIYISLLVVIAATLYGLTLRGVWGAPTAADIRGPLDEAAQPFELSPERGRYAHVMALAERGTYALDTELAQVAYPDVGYEGDRYFSFFAPGIPYIAMPFYRIGAVFGIAQVGTYAAITLCAIISLMLLYMLARQFLGISRPLSAFAALTFGFGSTAWGYATTLYQHHVTTMLLLVALYSIFQYRRKTGLGFMWASFVWLAYAVAIFIDYPNALLFLPVMAFLAFSTVQLRNTETSHVITVRLAAVTAIIAFIVVSGFHAYHNAYYLGSWQRLSGSLPDAVLDQAALQEQVSFDKDVVGFFSEESVPRGFYTLLVSPDRGLLLYAPIFLLALVGIVYAWRFVRTPELYTILATIVLNIILYSSWGDPWGGWAYGPRYLIPSMALLSLFIAFAIHRSKRSTPIAVVTWVLFAVSCAVALLGALTTNAVPPMHEAVSLENLYNYRLNVRFLTQNKSSSFIYNSFLAHAMSLRIYFGFLYAAVMALAAALLVQRKRYDD